MSIGNNIRAKRLEKKYTLEELAKKVGTSKQTIQRYESGIISNIPSDKIELLAKALDTTPAYLMGWDEENKSNQENKMKDQKAKMRSVARLENDTFTEDEDEQISNFIDFILNKRKNNDFNKK
mgnify:CR=1 FL=1